jgi:hypothetical protein
MGRTSRMGGMGRTSRMGRMGRGVCVCLSVTVVR